MVHPMKKCQIKANLHIQGSNLKLIRQVSCLILALIIILNFKEKPSHSTDARQSS